MRKYTEVRADLDNLQCSKKEKALTLLISVILGLVIISGPLTLCINLLVFINYGILLLTLIGIIGFLGLTLIDYFYLKGITKGNVKGIESIILIDSIIIAVFMIILMIIIGIKGGII